MILSAMIVLICITVWFQPTKTRKIAACCFAGFIVFHDRVLGELDGFAYYGSAALADLIVVALLHKIEPTHKMALALQRLCIVSILTNLAGYLLWLSYSPPMAYDLAFVAVFAWAVWIMTRDLANVGDPTGDRGGVGFWRNGVTRRATVSSNKGNA